MPGFEPRMETYHQQLRTPFWNFLSYLYTRLLNNGLMRMTQKEEGAADDLHLVPVAWVQKSSSVQN